MLAGKFCYVLNSRQMGKSSLCVRTMKRLEASGVRTAFVDLTKIGGRNLTPEQWYAGIAIEIGRSLGLRSEILCYWNENALLSPMQRLFGAIRDVVLKPSFPSEPSPEGEGDHAPKGGHSERKKRATRDGGPRTNVQSDPDGDGQRVAIFFDEIDATRSLPFNADEFFAGIRECHNRRVQDPAHLRLTFCLLGVAVPSDLINSPTSTPFNVGERIYLRDFTLDEAMSLSEGLPGPSRKALLERVYHWTNGHPFLTQSLCAALSGGTPGDVDALIRRDLFQPKARETNINLADVANRALHAGDLEPEPDKFRADLLSAYARAWRGKPLQDDESNRVTALLKLSGIMRSENGQLKVRNRIYETVFGRSWIRENMPGQELRRQRRAFWIGVFRTTAIAAVVIGIIGYLAWSNARLRNAAVVARDKAEYEAYAAETNLMGSAFEDADLTELRRLLEKSKSSPYRGIEWAFWNARLHETERERWLGDGRCDVTFSADGQSLWAQVSKDREHDMYRLAYPSLSTLASYRVAQDTAYLGSSTSGGTVFDCAAKLLGLKVGAKRGADYPLECYDVATGGLRYRISTPNSGWGSGFYFSPSRKALLATYRSPGNVNVDSCICCTARDGRKIFEHTFKGWRIQNNRRAISDDGTLAVVELADPDPRLGAEKRRVAIFDANKNAITYSSSIGSVEAACITSDGRVLVYLDGRTFVLHEVDVAKGVEVRRWQMASAGSVDISSDGSRLFFEGNRSCQTIDVKSGSAIDERKGDSGALSPDGQSVAMGGDAVRLFSVGKPLRTSRKYPGIYHWLYPRLDGNLVLYSPHTLRLLDGNRLQEIGEPVYIPSQWASLSSNGLFRMEAEGKRLLIRDSASNRELFRVPIGWADCASSRGPVLLADSIRSVALYETSSKKPVWRQKIQANIRWLCLSPNNRLAAVCDVDSGVTLIDAGSGRVERRIQAPLVGQPNGSPQCMKFSPDAKRVLVHGADLAWVGGDGSVDGVTLEGATDITDACFSPDGQRVLVSTASDGIQIFDPSTGRRLTRFDVSSKDNGAVAVDSGQTRIYTGDDHGVSSWSLKN